MAFMGTGVIKYLEEELGFSCAKVQLDYSNYVYHQQDNYDMMQEGIGIVEDYDDWEGNEDNWSRLNDEDYNRFTWLVEEGEEVYEGKHLATIETKVDDCADDYWVILVASHDGFIHREIKNGKHPMDSKERAATIYYTMEDYEAEVLATGEVKVGASKITKCPTCGTMLYGNKKFCGECGAQLVVEETSCTKCGAKLSKGQKFCCECGTKVE